MGQRKMRVSKHNHSIREHHDGDAYQIPFLDATDLFLESTKTRSVGQMDQVGVAGAIRGAEPGDRTGCSFQTRENVGPGMFLFDGIGGHPDFNGSQGMFDIVHVPV